LTQSGETQLLLQHQELIEGPKMLFKDGWFYLIGALGGTSFNHAVLVARSRSVLGPYQVDDSLLLTTRDDPNWPLQRAGHGELVQAPSGEWFMSYLTARPLRVEGERRTTLGRETGIAAVEWVDGWPRLKGGGWHPVVEVDVSDAATSEIASRVDSMTPKGAGFGSAPGWPWSTLREPAGEWLLADGAGSVVLRGRNAATSLWQQSLLAQRVTEHQVEVSVVVDAEPRTYAQSAGLIFYYNTSGFTQAHVTWQEPDGAPLAKQGASGKRLLVIEHVDSEGARIVATTELADGPVRVGASVADGVGRFYVSRADDGERLVVAENVDMTVLSDETGNTSRFTGTFVGVNAVDLVDGKFTAKFSNWQLVQTAS
jgi:xylan 1,4-beta-xylosidase